MSLKSAKKTYGVPRFNGNSEKFPMFRMKFDGLIFSSQAKKTSKLQPGRRKEPSTKPMRP